MRGPGEGRGAVQVVVEGGTDRVGIQEDCGNLTIGILGGNGEGDRLAGQCRDICQRADDGWPIPPGLGAKIQQVGEVR